MRPNVIVERWRFWRTRIDRALDEVLSSIPEVRAVDAAKYIVEGGKRFRGFLTILVAEELGGNGGRALDAAVALELVHASSLALDDIIDEDTVRRGKPAAWVALGVQRTVMVSNLLIPLAQTIVYRSYGVRALERTIAAWLDVSRGEVIDAFYLADELPSEAYYKIVRLKTGALFRLSAELGAIAAGREDLLEAAALFGEKLGLAYQLADDTVDLVLESRGRSVKPSTGYLLFRRLVGSSVSRALELLRQAVDEAVEAAARLRSKILALIPSFMASAMLEEAGVSL